MTSEDEKFVISFSNPPAISYEHTSVLVRAIQAENATQVKYLLEKEKCDPNKAVGERQTRPLMHACYVKDASKRLSIFKQLLSFEADVMLSDAVGQNSLVYCCALRLDEEAELLLKSTIYTCFKDADVYGNILLHVCAKSGNTSLLAKAIKTMSVYNIDINTQNSSNQTALDMAVQNRKRECAEMLSKALGYSMPPKPKLMKSKSTYLPNVSKSTKVERDQSSEAGEVGVLHRTSTYARLPLGKEKKVAVGTTGSRKNSVKIKPHAGDTAEKKTTKKT